jgi:EAL domain-containing protein (putative c-di-GMP-specific phosphodiesterase class I)
MNDDDRAPGAEPRYSSVPPADPKGHLLVVDDDAAILRILKRSLASWSYSVDSASNGEEAAAKLIAGADYDAIVSDISMPGMDGLELLRTVRQRDMDVPVILVTGDPALATAMRALEYGAYRYLAKPFAIEQLLEVVDGAVRVSRMAKLRRRALELSAEAEKMTGDRRELEQRFDKAIAGLWVAYQPIVDMQEKKVFAYEGLVRSREPSMTNPMDFLDAAEKLNRLKDIGRAVRRSVAAAIDTAGAENSGVLFFVNLHARDLLDEDLLSETAPLAKHAARVVLEITERASLDGVTDARARVSVLRHMGYRIAIDDLGAGYAGLTTFAQLQPDVVKLDMALVRGLHKEPTKQKLIRSIRDLCRDMGMLVVAEGIEEIDERNALAELGCDLMQGYYFARPGPPFPTCAGF